MRLAEEMQQVVKISSNLTLGLVIAKNHSPCIHNTIGPKCKQDKLKGVKDYTWASRELYTSKDTKQFGPKSAKGQWRKVTKEANEKKLQKKQQQNRAI